MEFSLKLMTIICSNSVDPKREFLNNIIHKVNCMSSGIDEDTLAALESDLEALSPVRVQTILRFAEKCAFDRHNLTDADYDEVRDQGVTDEEMIEIVALTALSTYLDIIADSFKLDVDDVIKQALAG